MKTFIIRFILAVSASRCFSQDTAALQRRLIFDDTAFVRTVLTGSFKGGGRVAAFNCGSEAVIYLSENNILAAVSKRLAGSGDYERTNAKSIIDLLKQYKNTDTIFLKDYPAYFKHLVSEQLKNGSAKVFDKKSDSFAAFIYQRPVRVISTAYRVFYFDDKRRFFQVQEWSGIIPNELIPDIE